MRFSRLLVLFSILGALSAAAGAFAQPSFERDVEPIFKTNCYSCHGGTAMVGLDLRTATSILRGSHEGPVVVRHAPEESLLYRKVSQRLMPPPAFNLKLTDSEIDTVRRWVEAGAPSDEEATIAAKREEETARFNKLALPIFEDRCFACHATDQPMGGLDLRTVQSVLKGSESGPVISDLGSIKSILIRKLTSREMPPPGMGQPLSDGEIRTLARWIDTSDFRLLRPHVERTTFNQAEAPPVTEEDRQFWSFRKPVAAPVPKVKDRTRVRTPIDAFLLERLESEGLAFSPDASKLTLLRRAWLDLIGVPPSPKDIRAFLEDERPDAYERLIETLLESEHYGERWGRHWLDAAGYSDVSGFDSAVDNVIVVDGMWRYRDWVIRAFNQDMPYDRFLVEQLAGDELVDWRSAGTYTPEILDKLVATGYLRSVFDRTDQDVVNPGGRAVRRALPPDGEGLHRPDGVDHGAAPAATATSTTPSRNGTTIACCRSSPPATTRCAGCSPRTTTCPVSPNGKRSGSSATTRRSTSRWPSSRSGLKRSTAPTKRTCWTPGSRNCRRISGPRRKRLWPHPKPTGTMCRSSWLPSSRNN